MDPNSLMPTNASSWLAEYNIEIIICTLVTMFGSACMLWYKLKNARRIKREEETGKQQVDIYNKVLELLGELESRLGDYEFSDILSWMATEKTWIQGKQLLLPQKFMDCWNSVKREIRRAQRKDQEQQEMADDEKKKLIVEEISRIRDSCVDLVQDGEKIIRKECGLPPL